jgi:hypothetical protein
MRSLCLAQADVVPLQPVDIKLTPGAYSTQFTMKCSIGNYGQQIHQPSNPFANLSQIALRESQLNALKAIFPELDNTAEHSLPRYSHDNGDGYAFLTPRQKRPEKVLGVEGDIIEEKVGLSTL